MPKQPIPVTLRPFATEDTTLLQSWYGEDREGLEAFFGVPLPSEDEYRRQFGRLFQRINAYSARMLMAEFKGAPVGFVLVTDVPPTLEVGRVHIYLQPKKRRYALRVGTAGMAEVKKMGLKSVFLNVASNNTGALKLGERLGFTASPYLTIMKELR
jgi:RimJ/RimL family protein N-acetyltransferase